MVIMQIALLLFCFHGYFSFLSSFTGGVTGILKVLPRIPKTVLSTGFLFVCLVQLVYVEFVSVLFCGGFPEE